MAEESTARPHSQEHFIDHLTIENFKSIRKLELRPKRINLFVGRPNTGKSNILEAIEILGNAYIRPTHIRVENIFNIFYNNDIKNSILISSLNETIYVAFEASSSKIIFKGLGYSNASKQFSTDGVDVLANTTFQHDTIVPIVGQTLANQYTKYRFFKFSPDFFLKSRSYHTQASFLVPPFGENLVMLLSANKDYREFTSRMLGDYNLQLLSRNDGSFVIAKILDGVLIEWPAWFLADTLRRQLFFMLAVKSNHYAILLLEEPESHSYPPYVSMLATEIAEAKTNQFFIATHSPYLINTLWNEAGSDEVQIFLTDYVDHQTVVTPLDPEEVQFVMENNGDLLLNLDSFSKQ